ncbi:hypothetical protein Tco_0140421 [Tanacetum coccineum]
MAFLSDNGDAVTTGQGSQELTTTTNFQIDDLDAFDSDYNEAPSASVVLMAKLSAYDSEVLSEMIQILNTSGSNVISYDQYLKEYANKGVQGTTSPEHQDALIMSVIEEMSNQVAQCNAMNKENKTHILYQDVMCIALHADVEINCVVPTNDDNLAYTKMEQSYIEEYGKVLEIEAGLSRKKNMVEKVVYNELSNRCSKLENRCISLEIKICHHFLQSLWNREVHVDYLQQAKEHADTLRAIVKQAKALKPLDSALDYACKFTTRIQELLVYVNATCLNSPTKNEKSVASTKIDKSKKVRLWFRWISFEYHAPLGFGSIAGGLDHVNHVIRLPIEHEISRGTRVGTDDEDAHEHVRKVLEIVDLFHFPGVTHDAVMLRVFPITLKGRALRWKKGFQQERRLIKLGKKYNDLCVKCHSKDPNNSSKFQIFYTGLDISTRKLLDSRGFITLMTPTQALKSIQVMADHSHNWYDETITKEKINDNPDKIDDIQESLKEAHPTKECPLKKEDDAVEESKYIRSLEETIIKFYEESIKKQAANDE